MKQWALILVLTTFVKVDAAVINAASLSVADVSNAVAAASSGDTVVLPAGAANWTSGIVVATNITLQGSGTVWLTNNISTAQAIMFDLRPGTNQLIRFSRINISGAQSGYTSYPLKFNGTYESTLRVDRCVFRDSSQAVILTGPKARGTVDHCTFIDCKLAINYGSTAGQNDYWAAAIGYGTTNGLYVEANTFLYTNWYPISTIYTVLHDYGARAVWRYNTWTNLLTNDVSPIIDMHGNVNGTNTYRGTRLVECYQNTFWSTNTGNTIRIFDNRGGTLVAWGNTFIGSRFPTSFQAREEDGQDMGWGYVLTNYPGYDQHWIYFGTNTVNGSNITTLSYYWPATDPTFIVENTNLFWSLPGGYAALAYPHPIIREQDGNRMIIGTARVGTLRQ